MTEQKTEEKRLTIHLDDRTVRAKASEWPETGGVQGGHKCGQYGQNGSLWWRLHIRQHADGRALVYMRNGGRCQCNRPHVEDGGVMLDAGWTRAEMRPVVEHLIGLGIDAAGGRDDDIASDTRTAMQSLPTEDL